MQSPIHPRRLVAVLAAYLVALQALLLPLTIAAGADVAIGSALCQTVQGAEGGTAPAGHDTGCACAAGCGMQCHTPAFGAPPQQDLAIHRLRVVAVSPAMAVDEIVRPADRGPVVARGPPAA